MPKARYDARRKLIQMKRLLLGVVEVPYNSSSIETIEPAIVQNFRRCLNLHGRVICFSS
jgi:hypothetical protein